MVSLKKLSGVMARPTAYRLWQAPFAKAKFAPIRQHNDLAGVRRVLDVGCGPGTNTALFQHADYVGLDINENYIRTARRRFGRTFVAADACKYEAPRDARFDFILVNSLLHHIDTRSVEGILQQLHDQLTPDGHVHIVDLVMPEAKGMPRFLARSDRGDFPRPLAEWRRIFTAAFEEVVFEPFPLTRLGVTLWELIYFKGRRKGATA